MAAFLLIVDGPLDLDKRVRVHVRAYRPLVHCQWFVETPTMARIEEVEAAVLEQVSTAGEELPKAIMDELQRRPDMTRSEVSEAIWRLVASRRVRLTKSLRLRADEPTARS
jgi:predicted oxidoreductase